jgi:methylthioribulose-1-phosphate dehydratase
VVEDFSQIAASLSSIAGDFYTRGWVLGTSGNLSAVVNREPLCLAMSPSGLDKGALTPEQFLLINEDAKSVGGFTARPSAESRLHIRVVRERNAGAVLHTHSVWSTMLSDLHAGAGGLAVSGYEMLKGLEGVTTHDHSEWLPILDNSQDMPALAEKVGEVLNENPAAHGFLLRRHGLYSWGEDLAQAKRHIEILEFLLETVGRTLLATAGGTRAKE